MPRLAVLADVHLSTPGDQFPGQDLSYTPGLVRKAAAMLEKDRPDRLMVAGDLTNFGTPAEYALARGIFGGRLSDALIVAGNHEMVRAGLDDFERETNQPPAELTEWASLPVLKLNTAVDRQDPHYWFGRLDEASLSLLNDVPTTGPLIVVLHHPLPGTVRTDNGHPMMTAINGERLRDQLQLRDGPTVVFSGHVHLPDVQRRGRVTYVSCPPLSFYPHAYLLADVDETHLSITTRHLDLEESPDASATANAYRRHREVPVPSLTVRLR